MARIKYAEEDLVNSFVGSAPEPETTEEPLEIVSTLGTDPDPTLETLLVSSGISQLAQSPELQRVIRGAMNGSLPLEEPLEVNQPTKLSPRAIQTVLLTVGRFYTLRQIAEISGMNYVYVTKLVKHPYAKRIRSIANASTVAQFNAVERQFKRKAPRMLKIVSDIAVDETNDAPTRLRAAFGWIDRAGYGETKKSESTTNIKGALTVTHGQSALLAAAIREAQAEPEAQEADFEVVEESSEEKIA